VLRQVSAMPTNRFHGLGLWPSIPVLLARVPHQTADCFYRPGTALRGMTAGKGGKELYKQKQALNVSYEIDLYQKPRPQARLTFDLSEALPGHPAKILRNQPT
jgi:hypothetical protein